MPPEPVCPGTKTDRSLSPATNQGIKRGQNELPENSTKGHRYTPEQCHQRLWTANHSCGHSCGPLDMTCQRSFAHSTEANRNHEQPAGVPEYNLGTCNSSTNPACRKGLQKWSVAKILGGLGLDFHAKRLHAWHWANRVSHSL